MLLFAAAPGVVGLMVVYTPGVPPPPVRLLARGQSQAQIAEQLFISPKTVGGHIQRILTKLDVHSRAHAVALAHKHGLAEVEGHALVTHLQAV